MYVSRAIWKFFYNRWYLNTALYWGAVLGPMAIYRIIWRYFESTIIDGINPGLQGINDILFKSYQGWSNWNNTDISFCFCCRTNDNNHVAVLIGDEYRNGFLFDSSVCNCNTWAQLVLLFQ